ncbi:hypothetical protein BBJ28_00018885, partial [Nothophytophthora sp. Chile5]
SGIVGAGGNMGGLAWSFLFKGVGNRAKSFEYLSFFVAAGAVSSLAINVHGERSLWSRGDGINGRGRREQDQEAAYNDTTSTW